MQRHPSTMKVAADDFLTMTAMDDEGVQERVERITRDVGAVQDKILDTILTRNAGIEYFQRHGVDGVPSKHEFKQRIPIISYKDIEADIQRIAHGDSSQILCAEPVNVMLTSSGTSGGKQKLFPKLGGYDPEFVVLNRIARAALNKQAPYSIGKSMQFIYVRKPGMTPGGVITCSGLSGYFTSPAFLNRKVDPASGFTSPDEVIVCVDYEQSSYCHLLCGLIQSQDVVRVGAVFASTLVRSLKRLKDCWKDLCSDIRTGKLNTNVVSDLSVRDAMAKILKPNPQLADVIFNECSKDSWKGIIRRLWPNAKLIEAIVTGSMQQYVPTIDYLSDGLPIASSLYASSESSTLGVNLNPICPPSEVLYTLFPCFAYYEFLPISKDRPSEQPIRSEDLVELADVQVGQEYELVITTKAGLYRYQIGDVLKVVKFHNNAPQFSFMQRAGVLLSVDTDKTDELELHNAVTRAREVLCQHRDVQLLDYTSRVDLSSEPGHYVVYWETDDIRIDPLELQQSCAVMEQSLNAVFRRNRSEGIIGALEIKLVEPGTFDRVIDLVVCNGGSIAQYKTPRCLRNPGMIQILESCVYMTARADQQASIENTHQTTVKAVNSIRETRKENRRSFFCLAKLLVTYIHVHK